MPGTCCSRCSRTAPLRLESEKIAGVVASKDKASDSGSEVNSVHGEENGIGAVSTEDASSVSSDTVRSWPASKRRAEDAS